MPSSVIQRSFSGGELAPALHARADQAHYLAGLRQCRNFIIQRSGGAANRAGLRFVGACKTSSATVMLLRYVSEIDGESVLLELGNGYIRFYQNGAALTLDPAGLDAWDVATNYVVGDVVTNAGVTYYALLANVGVAPPAALTWYAFTGNAYELPSPFGAHLPNWVQSGRVITLTHKDSPPYDLICRGLTSWVLRPVDTHLTVPAPAGLVLTPAGAGTLHYGYVVTSGAADTYEESVASAQVINAAVAAPTAAAPNVVTWAAVPGVVEYYVYADPFGNGTYGFVGTSTGATTFRDPGIPPDFAITPPLERLLFDSVDNYPHVCAYFQQRRFFGYTNNNPDSVWASRTGFPSNFGISSPLQDDDALTFRIAGNNHNPVKHLVALKQFIVLTTAGEWTVGQPKVPLTPSTLDADEEAYVGASDAPPVIVGNAILYVQARGHTLHDLQFEMQVEGLGGKDLTVFATHLVDDYTLPEIDFALTPHSVVWCVRSDGTLLGLTYVREQDIWAWHRHDTGASGRFEHVCVVPELDEDAVYVIVKRTIGGVIRRYIERLERRQLLDFNRDAFFVDSGLTYDGPPVLTVTGLGHLEGQPLAVLADGVSVGPRTVTGGAITIPTAARVVHAGLPITADLETLDLDVQGTSLRDKKKKVGGLTLLLDASGRGFYAGPDSTHLTRNVVPPYDGTDKSFTGQVEMNVSTSFSVYGRVFIRQTDPLPLTVLGIIPSLEVGG